MINQRIDEFVYGIYEERKCSVVSFHKYSDLAVSPASVGCPVEDIDPEIRTPLFAPIIVVRVPIPVWRACAFGDR